MGSGWVKSHTYKIGGAEPQSLKRTCGKREHVHAVPLTHATPQLRFLVPTNGSTPPYPPMRNPDVVALRSELIQLPPLKPYLERLRSLRSEEYQSLSIEEVKNRLIDHCGIIPHLVMAIPAEKVNSLSVYRARVKVEQSREALSLLRTFSYPSQGHADKPGRANTAKHPVFYGAMDVVTAIMEVQPQVGEDVYISRWGVRANRICGLEPLLPLSMPQQNPAYSIALDIVQFFNKEWSTDFPQHVQHGEELVQFIADLFMYESAPYAISSFLANDVLYGVNGIDMIVYPSCEALRRTCNLAIHPNFVDQYMYLEKLAKVRLSEIHKDGPELGFKAEICQIGHVSFP